MSTPARRVRAAAAAGLAIATLALGGACANDPADPARPATVRGTVTIVGDPIPPIGAEGSQVYLLLAPDAAKGEAVRRAAMTGGPRVFAFALADVPPGRYYLQACLQVGRGAGCANYTVEGSGDPDPIDVRAGRTTEVVVRF